MIREPWPGYQDEVARAIEQERRDFNFRFVLSSSGEHYVIFALMTFAASVVIAILALALTHSL
jgi:hypothetical protein